MRAAEYVFGYGSLVVAPGHVTDLLGYARGWGVAMDNARDLPGYKCYLAPDGSRPDVFVAFLDVAPSAGSVVNGVCTPVAAGALGALDARERNYGRIDVTEQLADALGRTWAYAGSPDGRDRFAQGAAESRCVIAADYLRLVQDGFRRLGTDEHRRAEASLEPGGLPVLPLRRVDLGVT